MNEDRAMRSRSFCLSLGHVASRAGAPVVLAVISMLAAAPALAGPGHEHPSKPSSAAMNHKAEPGWQIASAKHGGSGVVLRYAVPDKVALGETVTVRLRLSGVTAADGATVEVRDPALGTTLAAFTLASGEQRALELPFTARVDGLQFIDVATRQAGRRSVQSVPLVVGSGALRSKPEGQRGSTASGEAVISLPAATPGNR